MVWFSQLKLLLFAFFVKHHCFAWRANQKGAVYILRTPFFGPFWPTHPPCTPLVHLWLTHPPKYVLCLLTHPLIGTKTFNIWVPWNWKSAALIKNNAIPDMGKLKGQAHGQLRWKCFKHGLTYKLQSVHSFSYVIDFSYTISMHLYVLIGWTHPPTMYT